MLALAAAAAPAAAAVLPAAAAGGAAAPAAPFQLDPAVATPSAAPAAITAGDAPKAAGGKIADKQEASTDAAPAAGPGELAWLMAMLGGAADQPRTAAAAPAAASADAGIPTAAPAKAGAPAAAQADSKAAVRGALAVQPPPAAAGPVPAAAAPPAPSPADTAVAAGEDGDTLPATTPTATSREAAPAPAPRAEAPPVPSAAPAPPAADAVAQLQSFARVLGAAGSPAAAPAATAASAAPHTALDTGHGQWPLALADQVQWQLGHEVQEARLELHPRDLGAVHVQVRITSEGAEVRFAAAHPQAREVLQAALPQLKSLLQGDGVLLAQSQVGAQSSWQAPAQPQRQPRQPQGAAGDGCAEEPAPAAATRILRVGLVDDFA